MSSNSPTYQVKTSDFQKTRLQTTSQIWRSAAGLELKAGLPCLTEYRHCPCLLVVPLGSSPSSVYSIWIISAKSLYGTKKRWLSLKSCPSPKATSVFFSLHLFTSPVVDLLCYHGSQVSISTKDQSKDIPFSFAGISVSHVLLLLMLFIDYIHSPSSGLKLGCSFCPRWCLEQKQETASPEPLVKFHPKGSSIWEEACVNVVQV